MSDLQHFLSLMDTIHDYGNTGRTAKSISRKQLLEGEDDDKYDEIESFTFNKAFLVDFLMLALIQNNFKDTIGLSKKQNYLTSRNNCASDKVNSTPIAQNICSRFYFPTYEGKIVFRSPKPEAITKDILFASKNYKEGDTFETTINYTSLESKLGSIDKLFCEIFKCKDVRYVLDANSLDNSIFDNKIYHGLFKDYDAAPNTRKYDDALLLDLDKLPDLQKSFKEFQEYELTKSNGELIFLENIRVVSENNEYIVKYHYKTDYFIRLRRKDEEKKFSTGLSQFVQIINAINENTLGVQQLRKGSKENLRIKLERVGIEVLHKRYSIFPDFIEFKDGSNGEKESTLFLNKSDFIMALFDFKRAMDYLYVKACHTANTSSSRAADTQYVFISSDRSAIYYAINLGCPCVLTLPVIKYGTRKGEQDIIVYNPYFATPPPKPGEKYANIEELLKTILEKENLYELQDEVEYLIHQLEVNEILINEKLLSERKKKKKNKSEIDRLERLISNIGTAYDELYGLQMEIDNSKKPPLNPTKVVNSIVTKQKLVNTYSPKIPEPPGIPPMPEAEEIINDLKTPPTKEKDMKSLMEKYLKKEKCQKWLLEISSLDPSADIPFPYGFKWIKEDPESKRATIESLKQYCLDAHGLHPYWASLLQEGGFRFPIDHHCFHPNIEKAGKELESAIKECLQEGNSNTKMHAILEQQLLLEELDVNHESIAFTHFLKAYSQLSPTITFFWYLVFKTLCFHLPDA